MLNKKKLDPNWVPRIRHKYDGVVFHTTAYDKDKRLYIVIRLSGDNYGIGNYPYDDKAKSLGIYKPTALEDNFERRRVWSIVKRVSPLTDPEYLKYEKS